jgi:hypothetical protein
MDDVGIANWGALHKTQTIDNRRSKVHNTHINKLVYALRGHFMKTGNIQV